MDLTHHLRLPAPPEEVWAVVNDPVRLAEVVPGAVVTSAGGDTFSGTIKVKLGPTLLTLAGTGRFASQDEGARRTVVETNGADRRGDAGVEAEHTISLAPAPESAAETDVTVRTSMTWTGRPSRLGDGVVADAVERVVDQTRTRVAARVAEGLPWAPPAGAPGRAEVDGAEAVVDHPVELGADLGDLEGADGRAAAPSPAPSPGPSPRPARPTPPREQQYVYRPYDNAAEPHLDAARSFVDVVVKRVLPYAGLGALAVFAVTSAVRRARR